VVTGTLFLNSPPYCVLFDSGATHSFISGQTALQLNLDHAKIEVNYRTKLPNHSVIDYGNLYKHVPICLGKSIFPKNLIQFDQFDFDIILGINWFHAYGVKIDCKDLKVTLTDEKHRKAYFYGRRRNFLLPFLNKGE